MKVIACLAVLGVAQGFIGAPLCNVQTSSRTSLQMSSGPETRREMITKVLTGAAIVGAAVAPELAFADGARSQGTVYRARGIYGQKILDLGDSVKSGNFDAILGAKNSFTLFNSGGFLRKADGKTAATISADILSAAAKKDSAGVQAAYKKYLDYIKLDTPFKNAGKDFEYSQSYSSDYDFKVKTPKARVYVR